MRTASAGTELTGFRLRWKESCRPTFFAAATVARIRPFSPPPLRGVNRDSELFLRIGLAGSRCWVASPGASAGGSTGFFFEPSNTSAMPGSAPSGTVIL